MKIRENSKKKNIDFKLNELGVKNVKYYYYKTPIANNIYTGCLFIDQENQIISRGITICSILDTFNKKKGRRKSFSNALKAAIEKKNSLPIVIYPERWKQKLANRTFHIKYDNDIEIFNKKILPILKFYNCEFLTQSITMGDKTKMFYKIPRDYSLRETIRIIRYKAEFHPAPIKEELHMHLS